MTAVGAPAPAPQRALRRARWEFLLLMRNGEQLLLTLVLPVGLLIGLARTGLLEGEAPDRSLQALAIAWSVAVLSSALVAQAIGVSFDRRYGVLRLIGAGPLGRSGYVAARMIAVAGVLALQIVVLVVVALVATSAEPPVAGVAAGMALSILGICAYTGLALALAGTVRAETALALANLLYVLLLVGGGTVVSPDRLPPALGAAVELLPSAALTRALSESLAGAGASGGDVALLLAWAVAGGALAVATMRWDESPTRRR
jgi:ABC-2 type transport system permease protein